MSFKMFIKFGVFTIPKLMAIFNLKVIATEQSAFLLFFEDVCFSV